VRSDQLPSVFRWYHPLFLCVLCAIFSCLLVPNLVFAHVDEIVELYEKDQNSEVSTVKESLQVGKPQWEIDPRVPFVGSPVHEKMTMSSVTLSKVHGRPFNKFIDAAYIHGVFWNDDPNDLLCPDCSIFNLRKFDRRWGIEFAKRFLAAEKSVQQRKETDPLPLFRSGDGLLERSHFGDLQFLHAMASVDGESARETQTKILAWAEFTYKVATGQIKQKTKLNQIPLDSVKKLFVGDPKFKETTVEELFRGPQLAREAAIGSLLHMIQDSYAPGHIEREVKDYRLAGGQAVFARGNINSFHCYTDQDAKKHKLSDKWPENLDEVKPVGEENPIAVGARILQFMYGGEDGAGAPWPDVSIYLNSKVFNVLDLNAKAGAGEHYKKQEPAAGVKK
jgi:hypothetical protein